MGHKFGVLWTFLNAGSPMDGASDCASVLPWIWVIEALASVKEVDVSILHGTVNPDTFLKNRSCIIFLSSLKIMLGYPLFLFFRFD